MLTRPEAFLPEASFREARSITGSRGPIIYLIEVDAYNFTTQAIEHLRYGTDGFNAPDAPGFYQRRVMTPPDFGRFLLAPGATSGANQVTPGDVVMANNDRALDGLRDYGIGGQSIRILIGYRYDPYSAFIPLASGRVEQVLFDLVVGQNTTTDTVTLRFRDRLLDFSLPLQNHRYLGNNVAPDGIEGGDDLKSKPVPLVWGKVFNVTATNVNAYLDIYQVAENQIRTLVQVYDAGELLSVGTAYSSLADMQVQANAPTPGFFNWYIGSEGSYFRLGATPKGTITFDAIEGATDADLSAGQVAYRILTTKGGLNPSEISMADLSTLDGLNQNAVGIYVGDESNIQTPVDAILSSIGAAGGFDRLDVFRMRRINLPLEENVTATLRAPIMSSKLAVGEIRVISIRFIPTNDPDKGVPTYEQTINYRKNYTVQAGNGLASQALDDQTFVNFVGSEFRTTVRDAAWVKVGNPLAIKKTMDSLLIESLAADEECERQLTLYSGRRDFIELEVSLDFDVIAAIDIGDIVMLYIPAYGYDAGQPMLLTGMIYNTSRNILTIEAWGGRESVVIDLAETIGDTSTVEDWGIVGATLVGWTGIGTVLSLGIDRALPFDFGTLDIVRQFIT
jgi:hypothetical protein